MTLPVIMIPKQLKIEYETMSAQPESSANAPHSRRDERGGARIGGGGGGGRSSAAITLSASSACATCVCTSAAQRGEVARRQAI